MQLYAKCSSDGSHPSNRSHPLHGPSYDLKVLLVDLLLVLFDARLLVLLDVLLLVLSED